MDAAATALNAHLAVHTTRSSSCAAEAPLHTPPSEQAGGRSKGNKAAQEGVGPTPPPKARPKPTKVPMLRGWRSSPRLGAAAVSQSLKRVRDTDVQNASRRAPRRGADAQRLCLMRHDLCVALYTICQCRCQKQCRRQETHPNPVLCYFVAFAPSPGLFTRESMQPGQISGALHGVSITGALHARSGLKLCRCPRRLTLCLSSFRFNTPNWPKFMDILQQEP